MSDNKARMALLSAVALGVAYPAESNRYGYEYLPAPGKKRDFDGPRRRDGTFSSQGAKARRRNAWVQLHRLGLTQKRRGVVSS